MTTTTMPCASPTTPRTGLSGYVSGSGDRARAIARRIRSGNVHVGGAPNGLNAPFGGYKQSAMGVSGASTASRSSSKRSRSSAAEPDAQASLALNGAGDSVRPCREPRLGGDSSVCGRWRSPLKEIAMTKVTAQMSLSLDGCYAGPAFGGESGRGRMDGLTGGARVLPRDPVGDRRDGVAGAAGLCGWGRVGELRHRRGDVRRCRGLRDGPAHVRGR